MATVKKAVKKSMAKKPMAKRPMMQAPPSASSPMGGGPMMKNGGSFPDLNKDGKITKADILKGRGVIAKKGASVKAKMKMGGKCKNGC